MKLLMLKGLPGSGKSTWAKTFVAQNSGWVRINKDSLRDMMASYRPGKDESLILQWRNSLIWNALMSGKNVVVDDTNFHPKHEKVMRELIARAFGLDIGFEIKFFDTPLKDCIENDLKRANSVGSKVIKKMYNEFLAPTVKPQNWTIGLSPAIIVDIDGTVALHVARGPFDMEKCFTDKPNKPVVEIVKNCYERGFQVIFVSGREEKYRLLTEMWFTKELHINEGDYKLFMRPTDDHREDSIIKQEVYEREILGKYNIYFVLDDRNRVVEMWRRNGLTCLQVANGDF